MIVRSIVNNRGVNVVQNVLPSWEREIIPWQKIWHDFPTTDQVLTVQKIGQIRDFWSITSTSLKLQNIPLMQSACSRVGAGVNVSKKKFLISKFETKISL